MRKKFKKRLLGIILTILMVVSVIPVQQVQPVKAADTQIIYLEISGVSGWTQPGVHALDANNKIVNNLFAMEKVADSVNIYKANIAANATKVIFTPVNEWGKGETDTVSIADANADLTTTYPCYKVTSYQSGSKKCWKGHWTTYSTEDEVLKERFYVSTNLVDYINDARLGEGNKTRGYSNNNQGTVVNGSKEGSNVYSYLDAAISGSPWYNSSGQDSKECQYTYPLYFGNMFDTKNRYGRMLNGNWFGLNNFSVGANVALEESDTNENKFYGAAAQGLVGNKLVNGKMVDPNNTNVVLPYFSGEAIHPYKNGSEIDNNKNLSEYYNGLQFPFKQTKDKNGVITYSYDSGKDYAVYYNFEKNCFYESPEHIKNETTNDGTAPEDGFYPLNKPGDPRKAVNMGFGTEFTIPFTLSKDGKINGKDITFNFTGDDDVWVFIDDYLVLDMGGAHRMARGTIDFAQKNVTVERAFTPDKSTTAAWKDGATRANQTSTERLKTFADIKTDNGMTFADIMANDSKVHTLKMFYMERGMFDSNMSVSFNFSPIPSGLTLSKDVDTKPVNDGLKSVVETKDNFDFTVTDTDPRIEYNYEKDYNGTGIESETTKDGVVKGLADNVYAKNFEYTEADSKGNKGLKIGTDFTITEKENSNYSTRWFVTDISTLATKESGSGRISTFKLGEAGSDVTKVNYNVNFVNTPKVGTVNITKAWDGDVPDTLKNTEFPFKVEVDLDGVADEYGYSPYPLEYTVDGKDSYTTEADGSFKLKCGQKAAFKGIPIGATVKVTETKTTDGKSWVVSGQEFKESAAVTDGSNETLTITNATMTIPSDKVIYVEAGKDTFYKPANVETGYTVSKMSDGLTYTDKGFNGAEPNKSYTANYTGFNSDGAIVNGTITVYTYQATNKVYVFDYGLESDIAETNKNNDGLFQGGTFYNEEATGDMATTAKLGTITPAEENTQTTISSGSNNAIDSDGKADSPVTFKPVAFMDKVENYTYTANITKNGKTLDPKDPETGTTVNGTIKTMPANVVYYEDDFNAGSETTDGTTKIVYTGTASSKEGKSPDVDLTQSNGQTEQYGHDDAYTKGTGDSNGTSRKMADGAKATFTFTGTGFDVIARTTSKTAGITYIVSKKVDDSWTAVSVGAVDTYYANGDLYQIPVIHKDLGGKNTYKVTLRATKSDVASVIYLDGIRIYNPLGTAGNENYIDNEEGATFVKVSDLVLGNGKVTETGIEGDITNQVIDGSKAAILGYGDGALSALGYTIVEDNTSGSAGSTNSNSILQYLQAGPNNEVYLDETAAVAFVATADSAVTNKTIQVEAKLADLGQHEGNKPEPSKGMELRVIGADGTANVVANVTSSTAMYYSIDLTKCIDLGDNKYLVVIVGNSDYEPDEDYESGGTHCISFTNIKYKGYEFSSPYENDAAKKYIDMTVFDADRTKFASIDFPSVHKNVWSNYKCSVTLNENVFGDAAPKFKLYYKNINGELKPISVTAKRTKEDSNKYELRFRAPNALGNFAVELHYVVNGKESDDYIATTMTVKR